MTPYYEQDGITIYHGDALDILPTLPSVDLVVTDPPYIIGAMSAGSLGSKSGTWADMMNSALWFAAWYRTVRLKPTGAMWTFCNWRSLPVVQRAAYDAERSITSVLVWDKEWIGPGGPNGLRPSYELVALICGADFAIPDRSVPDIRRCKVGSYKATGHPAEKPVELMQWLIETSSVPTDGVVLDPFLGSGTTAVAAKKTGRRCIGIEADERYCEIAANRLAQGVLDFG